MLTENEIKRLISEDEASEKKRRAKEGQRYYEANHDILQYRIFYYNEDGILVEDKARSNSRICHPFFTELADQLPAYMYSFEHNPMQAIPTAEGLQEHLDRYFDADFWAEIYELTTGAYVKGFEYLYAYKNADDRLAFECADSLGVVEVRKQDTDDGCEYVIYHYIDRIEKGKKRIRRIQVHDKDQTRYYKQVDNGRVVLDKDEEINPKPNYIWGESNGERFCGSLGFIPYWRLDNCRKQFSGLKPIKGLIDDYDMMECGLSNNVQDFDNPIHLVKGYPGDDLTELQQNIRTKKIIGVGEGGDIDIKTIAIPYEARKVKADEDEKNIYRFGMGFNSAQSGDGNITNVVIRSRYTLLDLKAKKMGMRVKRLLSQILRPVIDEINEQHKTDYQYSDVEIKLEFNVPTNEAENAQNALVDAQTEQVRIGTLLNVAAMIGDEETLRLICDALDLDFDDLKDGFEERKAEAQETAAAMATLEGMVTDEQQAEVGTGALSGE